MKIQPLKDKWYRPDLTKDDIKERVNSESNYNNCKGYPNATYEDKPDELAPRIQRI